MPKWGGRGDRTGPRRAICADRQFVWGTRYVDDLVLRDRDTSEPKNGVLNERLYALQDPNFNVAALANTGGAIQERYVYEAFGRAKVLDADFSADADGSSDFAWEYRYTGRRYDLATGLYHYRSRPYHAELGRFLSRDPIGYGGGDPNLYRYVGNGAVSAADPLGLRLGLDEVLETYKVIWGQDDPYLQAFLSTGNEIEMKDLWWGCHDLDQVAFSTDYRIQIEENLDNPITAAFYLRYELANALGHCSGMKQKFMGLSRYSPESLVELRKQEMKAIAETLETVGILAETGLSIVSEGADWVITIKDLSEGHYAAAVGLLPLIPGSAGKGFRILARVGDELIPIGKIVGTRGFEHSFGRHAAQWFSRHGGRATRDAWQKLLEEASRSTKVFAWSTGGHATIAQLARIDGNKWFVVQWYAKGDRAGELATAFIPNARTLKLMLKKLGK